MKSKPNPAVNYWPHDPHPKPGGLNPGGQARSDDAMAKTLTKKRASRKATKRRVKTDAPGQKVMEHGPEKDEAMEALGVEYAKRKAAKDRARDSLATQLGLIQDAMHEKDLSQYSVAGFQFTRASDEKLVVKKLKDK